MSVVEISISAPHTRIRPQADQLIFEITAVRWAAPDAIQRNFQRLKNTAGGEEQQDDGNNLHRAARGHRYLEVAPQKMPESIGEIVVQGEVDGVDRGFPVQNMLAQGKHDDQKREKRQQHSGRNRKCVNVDLRLHQVAGRRQKCAAAALQSAGGRWLQTIVV